MIAACPWCGFRVGASAVFCPACHRDLAASLEELDTDELAMERQADQVTAPRPARQSRRDPLRQELAVRVGGIHALLEVDTDPALALAQLRQAQRELDATCGWLADRVLCETLLGVAQDLEREDTIEIAGVSRG